ncbi:MAG: CatA-like O-acetyltransferase, family 2 [Clostridium sp.]|nr:CatA-like O-acetyltransferase, family 2 [Bacteroides sp.]MCM1197696.1 CatA-like O-acetyltransferase, family 2 [Clostridium sp.]
MKEINPKETTRAYAFETWMDAPMPMVTFFRQLDVSRAIRFGKRHGMKFNMLMLWCIGHAAKDIKEFYMLPVGKKLMQYDSIALNTIVADSSGGISSCDIPFSEDLDEFSRNYLHFTGQVRESSTGHDITDSMVIGTSALAQYDIDGAVGMYSGIFNNPFMIWGRYRRSWSGYRMIVSFQFHHTQMDGAHAAQFLEALQREIRKL